MLPRCRSGEKEKERERYNTVRVGMSRVGEDLLHDKQHQIAHAHPDHCQSA
jgi:hypothetical protein